MYKINPSAPCFHREFISFKTALSVLEYELHGDISSIADMEYLWNKVMETGSIYLGETSSGHLFIVVSHTSSGTKYIPEFRNA